MDKALTLAGSGQAKLLLNLQCVVFSPPPTFGLLVLENRIPGWPGRITFKTGATSYVSGPSQDTTHCTVPRFTPHLAVAPTGANGCWVDCVPTAYAMGYMLPRLIELGFAPDSRSERLFVAVLRLLIHVDYSHLFVFIFLSTLFTGRGDCAGVRRDLMETWWGSEVIAALAVAHRDLC